MNKKKYLFNKKRYKILLLSILVILIGFILMSGGGSENPEIFGLQEILIHQSLYLSPL